MEVANSDHPRRKRPQPPATQSAAPGLLATAVRKALKTVSLPAIIGGVETRWVSTDIRNVEAVVLEAVTPRADDAGSDEARRERERIVAWLREKASKMDGYNEMDGWVDLGRALREAADELAAATGGI